MNTQRVKRPTGAASSAEGAASQAAPGTPISQPGEDWFVHGGAWYKTQATPELAPQIGVDSKGRVRGGRGKGNGTQQAKGGEKGNGTKGDGPKGKGKGKRGKQKGAGKEGNNPNHGGGSGGGGARKEKKSSDWYDDQPSIQNKMLAQLDARMRELEAFAFESLWAWG